MIRPQPKPVRAPKKPRKPMRRTRMKPSARGTKHSRRAREYGFMAFCHARGCELALDFDTQRILGISHDCSFEPIEFAHLHDRRRYAPGDIGAGLDRTTHRGIDGKEGGKATWYVALDRRGQHLFRMRLANRARMAWDALTPAEREEWDRRARERFERGRR